MSRANSSPPNRPSSSKSRTAWTSDEGYDNNAQIEEDTNGAQVFTGDTLQVSQKGVPVVKQADPKKSDGCCDTVMRGIRCLWATRQTEDAIDTDKELKVRTTLRELIVYLIFLAILCVLTFGMTSSTMFYFTSVLQGLFLNTPFDSSQNNFQTIGAMADVWGFMQGSLLQNGLYWEQWYNNASLTDDELGYIFFENKLLGVPRLRQLRVLNTSCTVPSDFQQEIKACYDSYAESIEDKKPFGLGLVKGNENNSAWFYQSSKELDGSKHWGMLATYGGGGFVKNLGRTNAEASAIIQNLFDNLWIDRGTRAVFIDFTVYNANINLFCQIRLVVEFPATGGAIPSWTFRTVKLIRYVSAGDYFVLACECIFALFILYYMIEEAIEIKRNKLEYFKTIWNFLDLIIIFISIVCIAFNVYRTLAVTNLLEKLLNNPDIFADFEFLGFWQTQFNNAVAFTVFLSWIKIFKYISFNKTMTQLSSTLAKCAKDVAGFAIMFFIVFLAYAQLGYLVFGTQIQDFSNFQSSIFTLFRIILGDFDFHALESAQRVIGPIFFLTYVFFVFFVLLNMFLAIINDTYSEVKAEIAGQQSEFEIGDYFKKGYNKMLEKLNIKREKIVDIQKTIDFADSNNDKNIDFDEWRNELKKKGYADVEIENLFAKYDLDGDRVLDENDQKRMQQDLHKQKEEISKEFGDLEDKVRPRSARRPRSSGMDADSDDESNSNNRSSGGSRGSGVSYEEFTVLSRRVDRMEHSIGSIVSKIDAVLVKLEAMEKAKLKRRETMSKILDTIAESDGMTDENKREQMERLVRDELERWDSEANIGSGQGSSTRMRTGLSLSRPGSGGASSSA